MRAVPIVVILFFWAGLAGASAGQRPIPLREAQGYKVKSIRFIHLKDRPFKNNELRAAMQTRIGQPFQPRFFRSDLGTLENLYRGEGYMGVEVPGKILELDEDQKLHLTIKIDSEERWTTAEVQLALVAAFDTAELDTTQLRKRLTIGPGEAFRYGEVVESERALLSFLNSQGYAQARVRNDLNLDVKKRRAAVVYQVDPGRKRYFGRILIKGGQGKTEDKLHTRSGLVRRYLTFREGELYDPEKLRRSRSNLARTDLFRSITLSAPSGTQADSLQPVEIRLQEKKRIRLGANFLLSNTEPRIAGNVQHSNWLGRGTRLGLDASLGQPLQGSTVYLTERNLFSTGADLTVAAGLTEEWGNTQVLANPVDSLQVALLRANDSILNGIMLLPFGDPEVIAREYISASIYRYRSIERLWQFSCTLTRTWETRRAIMYQTDLSVAWTRSRTRPVGSRISYNSPGEASLAGDEPGKDEEPADDDPFGDDPFGDDPFDEDPFDEDPFGDDPSDDNTGSDGGSDGSSYIDYSEGKIPLDDLWREILTDRVRALNFTLGFQRDTRDSQIAPSSGTFLRVKGLYAIQFGGRATRVFDGDFEARHYQPLGPYLVWAQALRLAQTASLRQARPLPQTYWKEFGGEGSVRGVERNAILAVGGGRTGINLRSELRFRWRDFGLVWFWDRAGVWRHTREVSWSGMVDGYGAGLRYTMGIPFRIDFALNDGFDKTRSYWFYFSIGQAF